MNSLINQYSFVLVALLFTVVTGLILLTKSPKWNDYLAFVVVAFGFIAAWVILHPVQTPLMNDAKKVSAMIGAGKPVLLEFQSPYCIACAAAKPTVDSLERELGDRVIFIRLNIQESVGMELAPVYKFAFTPTFIFFDAQGKELWRQIGSFDPQAVRDSLK